MEYTADEVPFGYYRYYKNNDAGPIVHVLERSGKKVVSFINKSLPVLVKDLPKDARFVKSSIDPSLEVSPEEIQGREQELCAYVMEVLSDNALVVTRVENQLCVSRKEGQRKFYFNLDIQLESIEINDEEEKESYFQ